MARRNRHGDLEIRQHESDSPMLPMDHLERFTAFKPEGVDFILDQTRIEADYRRKQGHSVNTFVFAERMFGQFFALVIGLGGIFGGVSATIRGYEMAGIAISTISIGTLAVVFVTRKARV
jgi:hypothetical protein